MSEHKSIVLKLKFNERVKGTFTSIIPIATKWINRFTYTKLLVMNYWKSYINEIFAYIREVVTLYFFSRFTFKLKNWVEWRKLNFTRPHRYSSALFGCLISIMYSYPVHTYLILEDGKFSAGYNYSEPLSFGDFYFFPQPQTCDSPLCRMLSREHRRLHLGRL